VYSFRFGVSRGRLPTILTMPARRLIAGTRSSLRPWDRAREENARPQIRNYGGEAQCLTPLALLAAFLLGIVAGSGLEIIVRSGRY
jgi:hypothetical protein